MLARGLLLRYADLVGIHWPGRDGMETRRRRRLDRADGAVMRTERKHRAGLFAMAWAVRVYVSVGVVEAREP